VNSRLGNVQLQDENWQCETMATTDLPQRTHSCP